MANLIIVTDLDGTLLDHDTYSFAAAQPALDELRRRGIPLHLATSKARTEVASLRSKLDLPGEDIPENGARTRDLTALRRQLREASESTGVAIRAIHEMSVEEIVAATGLPVEAAAQAKEREHTAPFLIPDATRAAELTGALEKLGLQWTRGGRFFHTFESGGKEEAVASLLLRNQGGESIGLGDAPNDVSFLRIVNTPVIVRSRLVAEMMAALPEARVTRLIGPAGWNEFLLAFLGAPDQSTFRP